MKKDFLLGIFLSLSLLAFALRPLGPSVVALRRAIFYLVYPTSSSMTSAFEYALNLGSFWRELLSSKEELERLKTLLKNKDSERLLESVNQQLSLGKERSLTFYRLKYRSPSAVGWVSRACFESGEKLSGNLAVVAYSLKHGGFAFLGNTLPGAQGFGPLSCLEMLTSPRFSLVVEGRDSQEEGLLRGLGEPDRLLLDYLIKDSSMRVGETLITSGSSMLAPAGIAVGRVIGFKTQVPGALFKEAYVEPYINLSRIQEIAVMNTRGSP